MSTVLAVSLAFVAINAFGGFSNYIIQSLRSGHIYTQGNGHITILKDAAENNNPASLSETEDKKIIRGSEATTIKSILEEVPGIVEVSVALTVTGLVSNGIKSGIFVGGGVDIEALQRVQRMARGFLGTLKFHTGGQLSAEHPYDIGVTKALARKLDSDIGSSLILSGPTISNQYNAIDVVISQFVDAPEQLLDDKLVVMPLELAQKYYDTDGVNRINVVIDESKGVEEVRARISTRFQAAGLRLKVFTWKEVSRFTLKVDRMFHVIFLALFLIISAIAVMSVIVTISMSILERTREIGTLRAMGMSKKHVVAIISIESVLLSTLGAIVGLGVLFVLMMLIHVLEPQWVPPQISRSIPLEIYLSYGHLASSFFVFSALSLIACIFPATKAANKNIVQALTYI